MEFFLFKHVLSKIIWAGRRRARAPAVPWRLRPVRHPTPSSARGRVPPYAPPPQADATRRASTAPPWRYTRAVRAADRRSVRALAKAPWYDGIAIVTASSPPSLRAITLT
jgi:hypothetical protein